MALSNEGNVFLNGRNQIIEMLKYMSEREREALIRNIRIRNPQLAEELLQKSFSFDDLISLPDHDIRELIYSVQPQIIGLALKNTSLNLQRKILSSLPREIAEQAFETMSSSLQPSKMNLVKRAQEKIVSILISNRKAKRIS